MKKNHAHPPSGAIRHFFQSRLFPALIVLIVVITLAVISAVIMRIYGTTRALYLSMIKLEADAVEKKMAYFFEPVVTNLLILQDWGTEGLVVPQEQLRLNAFFMPVLARHKTISSLQFASTKGFEYTLQFEGTTWVTGLSSLPNKEKITWKRWTNPHTATEEWVTGRNSYPWLEQWYGGTIANLGRESLYWSKPYMLGLHRQPGITIAAEWREKASRSILAYNLLSSEIRSTILQSAPRERAHYFLYTREDGIMDLTGAELPTNLKDGARPADPVVQTAVMVWKDHGRQLKKAFKFSVEGRPWYAEFRVLARGGEALWFAVVFPESYMLADMKRESYFLIALSIVVLAAAVVLIIFITRRHKEQLARLQERIERKEPSTLEEVMKLVKDGESASVEFKSSLRWDYRESKMNSKLEEVILKSIAAFSNGEGGLLFIGVSDDGEILGLQSDYETLKEKNRDYFELHLRNLVNAEYGIEYCTRHLAVTFHTFSEREFCMVTIAKGETPLFTCPTDKGGQKVEKFYVRSGNSSREIIKPSEISLYISKRFGQPYGSNR